MLTAKQTKFLASYQLTGNSTESAINAGYSAKNAQSQGCRLMKDPEILAELAKFQSKKAMEFTKADFVSKALKDYEETPLIEANRPRFLELAAKGSGLIGVNQDTKPNQTLNLTQINITGGESQSQLWELTRKLLGNE